tara:strand:- start:231 stop:1352 length:1122 start_codon:yes stop_codon:yes gene_type:complete
MKNNNKINDWRAVFYNNGNIKVKALYKNDQKNGPYEEYYENGQLKTIMSWKKGKPHGPYESYHKNGQLMNKLSFLNGKKNSLEKCYYKNGALHYKANYMDDLPISTYREYYENGKLKTSLPYKKGFLNGRFIELYENGITKTECRIVRYPKENGISVIYDPKFYNKNGSKVKKIKSDFIKQYFHENGKIDIIYFTLPGISPVHRYHENGQLKEIYSCWNNLSINRNKYDFDHKVGSSYLSPSSVYSSKSINDTKHGFFRRFYSDGTIQLEARYKKGLLNGVTKYFINGKIHNYRTYRNDYLNGIYKHYYDNGQLEYETIMKNGKPSGIEIIGSIRGKSFSVSREYSRTGRKLHGKRKKYRTYNEELADSIFIK